MVKWLNPTIILRYNAHVAVQHTSVDALLRGVDEFFMAEGPVHKTMRTLARRLSQEGIDYAWVLGK